MFKLQGGTPEEIPEVYKARSPIYHADEIEAPLLVRPHAQHFSKAIIIPPDVSR